MKQDILSTKDTMHTEAWCWQHPAIAQFLLRGYVNLVDFYPTN